MHSNSTFLCTRFVYKVESLIEVQENKKPAAILVTYSRFFIGGAEAGTTQIVCYISKLLKSM